MIFQELDLQRIFIVWIAQGLIILIFLLLFIKILGRKRNRYSIIISMIYLLAAIGFFLNLIYVLLRDEMAIVILDFLMIYLILIALVFVLLFNLNLLQTIQIFTLKKQRILFILYTIIIFVALFYPMDTTVTANYAPLYSWTKFIIIVIFYTGAIMIPLLYTSILVYKKFEADEMKKRWRFFIIGVIFFCVSFYNLVLYSTWHDEMYQTVTGVILLLTVITGGYFIYYGVGKSLSAD